MKVVRKGPAARFDVDMEENTLESDCKLDTILCSLFGNNYSN